MLRQNCNGETAADRKRKADSVLLRDDHLILLLVDGILAVYAAVRRWLERRRTRRALAALDPHQLRDIGVPPAEALRESRRWWSGRDNSRRALAELDDSQLSNLSEAGLKLRTGARQAGYRG
jgi:uncharacterized protein YjiS (DUF1127 family)